jgi:hypothetical protein
MPHKEILAMNKVLEEARRLSVATLLLSAAAFVSGPAMAASIFSDNFSGATIDPAWQLLAGQGSYSMVGDLRYNNQGPLSSPSGWSTTSLSLAYTFAGTEWEIDTVSTSHLAWCTSGSYTGPAMPNFGCSSGAQHSLVFVSFDPFTAADRTAYAGSNIALFDRGIDAWYGSNSLSASYGVTNTSGLLEPSDSGISSNIAGGTYWYQFIRNGGTLTMKYSSDGVHFNTAFSTPLANPANPFNELVLSGQTYWNVGSYSDFTSVNIFSPDGIVISPDGVPEPTTFGLFGLGLLALAGIRRTKR